MTYYSWIHIYHQIHIVYLSPLDAYNVLLDAGNERILSILVLLLNQVDYWDKGEFQYKSHNPSEYWCIVLDSMVNDVYVTWCFCLYMLSWNNKGILSSFPCDLVFEKNLFLNCKYTDNSLHYKDFGFYSKQSKVCGITLIPPIYVATSSLGLLVMELNHLYLFWKYHKCLCYPRGAQLFGNMIKLNKFWMYYFSLFMIIIAYVS